MISVVIPALNEVESVAQTISDVRNALDKAALTPYEILLVDDGSSDGTRAAGENAGAQVITNPHTTGYGYSIKRGIREARYGTVVIIDADGTYPADRIPALYERYCQGFDMVVGARSGRYYRESLLKSPLRAVLKRLVEFTASRAIPDINSGLRIFDKAKAEQFFSKLCDTFSFTTSLTLAFMMTNLFVDYIDIPYHERVGRTKVRLVRDSLRTAQYIVEATVFFNPLKIFVLLSAMCIAAGIVSFMFAATSHLSVFYYVGIGLLLMSVAVFTQGLLAVLLKQIMTK